MLAAVPELNIVSVALIAGAAVVWTLISGRFERWNVTAPMFFVVVGLVAANGPAKLVDVAAGSSTVKSLAEVALAVILFSDASRMRVRALAADSPITSRLLLLGLPMTIGLGVGLAVLVFSGLDPWVAAVIAASVAPTDAALGAVIFSDQRIPERIRRVINVESGLNDGIATPFVPFFIAAAATATGEVGATTVTTALIDIVIGLVIGLVVGLAGGRLLEVADSRGWIARSMRPIGVAALALLAWAGSLQAGGNGFIGAFVCGVAFAATTPVAEVEETTHFAERIGMVLGLVVWFMFGALMVPSLRIATWRDVVFAVLALTVMRMVPVALSLIGTGLDGPTVAFIGWFGPRGLASVVFALIAYDGLEVSEGNAVVASVSCVVVLSILAHGITAGPLSTVYARHCARRDSAATESIA